MSLIRHDFPAPDAATPVMGAYNKCSVSSKNVGDDLENLFREMENFSDLHLFVVEQESYFLEDVNELISEYDPATKSHYSMRLSRIAYDVAEKLNSGEGKYLKEAELIRDWAPKVERGPTP